MSKESQLRRSLIKLAHGKPELRGELVPLLKKASDKMAKEFPNEEALQKYLKKHPKADPRRHRVKPKSDGKPPHPDWGI